MIYPIIWAVTEHVDPMANSYTPKMTITASWREGKMFDYQSVPLDLSIVNDQVALAATFRKARRYHSHE